MQPNDTPARRLFLMAQAADRAAESGHRLGDWVIDPDPVAECSDCHRLLSVDAEELPGIYGEVLYSTCASPTGAVAVF